MVYGGIMYSSQTSLEFISGKLTAWLYIVLEPVVRPFFQSVTGAIFQQDNFRLHVADATVNSLHGYHSLQRLWTCLPWTHLGCH